VLRSTPAAFPELAFLPGPVRELVLWHRRGQLGHGRAPRIPGVVAALLGDRDGLFASACTQYRASMNAVAAWSKARLLMDYTGAQSIPPEVSLLETAISRPTQVALLQRRDGYEERLDVLVELPEAAARCVAEAQRLLAGLELFAGVADDELLELARTARPLALGPHERVIVQGLRGTSMFAVVDGEVEVLVRGDDGHDRRVATLGAGSLVGEISVLTGEPRTATVRAITGATLYELGPRQYERLVRSRPQLRDDLAALAATRLHHERVTPGARATPPKG
jgi:CRP-like cAMP-binding protein